MPEFAPLNHDDDAPRPGTDGPAACAPDGGQSGPPREGGGTTGEGNLAPMQASRTGGATGGVASGPADLPSRSGTVPPDA
jgi:hypothetical protein